MLGNRNFRKSQPRIRLRLPQPLSKRVPEKSAEEIPCYPDRVLPRRNLGHRQQGCRRIGSQCVTLTHLTPTSSILTSPFTRISSRTRRNAKTANRRQHRTERSIATVRPPFKHSHGIPESNRDSELTQPSLFQVVHTRKGCALSAENRSLIRPATRCPANSLPDAHLGAGSHTRVRKFGGRGDIQDKEYEEYLGPAEQTWRHKRGASRADKHAGSLA